MRVAIIWQSPPSVHLMQEAPQPPAPSAADLAIEDSSAKIPTAKYVGTDGQGRLVNTAA